MSFSAQELKRIEDVVGELCERRSPVNLKDKLRLSYSEKDYEVLLQEARPDWPNPSEWIESDIANLQYVRAANEWRLYWKRASGTGWLYEPDSSSKRLSQTVKEIDSEPAGGSCG